MLPTLMEGLWRCSSFSVAPHSISSLIILPWLVPCHSPYRLSSRHNNSFISCFNSYVTKWCLFIICSNYRFLWGHLCSQPKGCSPSILDWLEITIMVPCCRHGRQLTLTVKTESQHSLESLLTYLRSKIPDITMKVQQYFPNLISKRFNKRLLWNCTIQSLRH